MSMIKEMARAMAEKAREQGSRGLKWYDLSDGHKREWIGIAEAALDTLMECANTKNMTGQVMNDMCAAFQWPQSSGTFPAPGGLTESCARATTAFLLSAKDGK